MVNREQVSELNGINAFNTQVINTDTTTLGEIIDVSKFNAVMYLIQSGTITLGTITPVIEEGDDSGLSDAAVVTSTWLRYPAGETAATFTDADDNKVKRVGVITNKKYLRLSLTTASSANLTVGAILLGGLIEVNPAGQA